MATARRTLLLFGKQLEQGGNHFEFRSPLGYLVIIVEGGPIANCPGVLLITSAKLSGAVDLRGW